MLLYAHDNRRDPLTGLLNRSAFYDDCNYFGQHISAVVSIDMNGLKEVNDTQGHQAGDAALIGIGASLHEIEDEHIYAYRIGGDEFILLFIRGQEELVPEREAQLKESVEKKGYSISVGHALCSGESTLEEAIRLSDKMMYEDKKAFYRRIINGV